MDKFPLGSYPKELQEIVYAKVGCRDSKKLLKISKCSRDFILRHGPYHKPLERLEINVQPNYVNHRLHSISGNEVDYVLTVSHEDPLTYEGVRAKNAFIAKTLAFLRSSHTALIKYDDANGEFGELDKLFVAHLLVKRCQFSFTTFAELDKFSSSFLPQAVKEFTFYLNSCEQYGGYNDFSVDHVRKPFVVQALQTMFNRSGCERVSFSSNYHFFDEVLRGVEVKLITVDFHSACSVSFVSLMRFVMKQSSIPSRNADAQLCFRCQTNVLFNTKLEGMSYQSIHLNTSEGNKCL